AERSSPNVSWASWPALWIGVRNPPAADVFDCHSTHTEAPQSDRSPPPGGPANTPPPSPPLPAPHKPHPSRPNPTPPPQTKTRATPAPPTTPRAARSPPPKPHTPEHRPQSNAAPSPAGRRERFARRSPASAAPPR